MLNFILMHSTVTLEYFSKTVKNQSHINSSIIAHVSLSSVATKIVWIIALRSQKVFLDMGNQTDLIEYSDSWSLIGIICFRCIDKVFMEERTEYDTEVINEIKNDLFFGDYS